MHRLFSAALLATLHFHSCIPVFADIIDHWGTRPALPAVVHSVEVSPLQTIIALRGEWDFVTDPSLMGRHRMGKGPDWNEPDWSGVRKVMVPGCWEAQGIGNPGMSRPWSPSFDSIPRPLNHVYMGTARYQRSADIPKDWDGKRIWLKVGGVRTEAWFWVNQQRVAHVNTYCGAYKYDITDFVTPGEPAEIVATVCNTSCHKQMPGRDGRVGLSFAIAKAHDMGRFSKRHLIIVSQLDIRPLISNAQ